MLHIDEMVRRLTELAFGTNRRLTCSIDENLLSIIDRFEDANDNWKAKRTMVNKVNAEKAYKSLRSEYQARIQGV